MFWEFLFALPGHCEASHAHYHKKEMTFDVVFALPGHCGAPLAHYQKKEMMMFDVVFVLL